MRIYLLYFVFGLNIKTLKFLRLSFFKENNRVKFGWKKFYDSMITTKLPKYCKTTF